MSNVIDLDILRPEQKLVKLGGHEIDLSFIPCGITFEIDQIVRDLSTIKETDIGTEDSATKKAFELTVSLCAAFNKHKYPELDYAWFMDNVSAVQVHRFADAIKDSLMKSYAGMEEYAKN